VDDGKGKEALEIFEEMKKQGIQPDDITFIKLLNACSHSGLVDLAQRLFNEMKTTYGITPDERHYLILMDILSRKGHLDEAEKLLQDRPSSSLSVALTTLLGACRSYKDITRTRRLEKIVFSSSLSIEEVASLCVLISNIYNLVGHYDEGKRLRNYMREKGLKTIPGVSSLYLFGDLIHTFYVSRIDHHMEVAIKAKLEEWQDAMKKNGYFPDLSWSLHNVSDKEKEMKLCYHSEKLALALGILLAPKEEPIKIIKNLRVCGECHRATAWISTYEARDFIVRDANRWHHFKDGKCSCNNYW